MAGSGVDGGLLRGANPVEAAHPGSLARRTRPAVFRALGHRDPPEAIAVAGRPFRRDSILKHDSWAATALYRDAAGLLVICKFGREQSILGLPMGWLGRALVRRECGFMRQFAHLPLVPGEAGPVSRDGRVQANALARHYVEGDAFRHREQVTPAFFTELTETLSEVHRCGVAYVDLHKRENIIVDRAGHPHLIDFQVSVGLGRRWPGNGALARWAIGQLQGMDRYHLRKHLARCFPELLSAEERARAEHPPALVRAHRRIARPLRAARRRLLTWLGIRGRGGDARTELEPEIAFRGP
jgi:hypothetical protein